MIDIASIYFLKTTQRWGERAYSDGLLDVGAHPSSLHIIEKGNTVTTNELFSPYISWTLCGFLLTYLNYGKLCEGVTKLNSAQCSPEANRAYHVYSVAKQSAERTIALRLALPLHGNLGWWEIRVSTCPETAFLNREKSSWYTTIYSIFW